MKLVIQRVASASVETGGEIVGKIGKGFLVLFGAAKGDTQDDVRRLAKKMLGLRIFSDENDKINLSLSDVSGSLLIVSQFTLYADCRKGNRPSFINACNPDKANELYEYFIELCKESVPIVEKGIFGADMKVSLLNDGPFTIILESEKGEIL